MSSFLEFRWDLYVTDEGSRYPRKYDERENFGEMSPCLWVLSIHQCLLRMDRMKGETAGWMGWSVCRVDGITKPEMENFRRVGTSQG